MRGREPPHVKDPRGIHPVALGQQRLHHVPPDTRSENTAVSMTIDFHSESSLAGVIEGAVRISRTATAAAARKTQKMGVLAP